MKRVTYRRRLSYNTKSNKFRQVKTPSSVKIQYTDKLAKGPSCGDCHTKLYGIRKMRPRKYHTLSRREKKVTRAYGGSRCMQCVRERITRAFLVEEQKIVKRVIKLQEKKKK